jgi:hypothetical protein
MRYARETCEKHWRPRVPDKVLAVSAFQVRMMGYMTTWDWGSPGMPADERSRADERNLRRGLVMLRTVWLADIWPSWPYYVDDPDGADFGRQDKNPRLCKLLEALEVSSPS